jgi:DNA repair protein RadC
MRREALRVAHLDSERRLIGVRLLYSDLVDALDFPLRTIIADALALGTRALLLAHNHPSGNASPSRADLAATRALADLTGPLDIRLLDHLIFGGGDCRSLRALGLL